jgi:formylglycine-generating enzyme required for sulfatase activity
MLGGKIAKGGSWRSRDPAEFHVGANEINIYDPKMAYDFIGVRCVADLPR